MSTESAESGEGQTKQTEHGEQSVSTATAKSNVLKETPKGHYKIRTLKDIFELPTTDMMERALKELVTLMKTTRALLEMVDASGEAITGKNQKLYGFPDEILWRDDHGVPSEVRLPAGEKDRFVMEVHHGEKVSMQDSKPTPARETQSSPADLSAARIAELEKARAALLEERDRLREAIEYALMRMPIGGEAYAKLYTAMCAAGKPSTIQDERDTDARETPSTPNKPIL